MEILRDILWTTHNLVDVKYKEMVDERIQRDSSYKELVDGHYATAAMLKKAVKQFKEQNEGKMSEELETLDNMLKNNNNKIKVKINLNPLIKASLPFLHVGLSLGNNRLTVGAIVDTGSSHIAASETVMKRLGIKLSMLRNRDRYQLTTVMAKAAKSPILGEYPVSLHMKDKDGEEHTMEINIIFMRTQLKSILLSWGFLQQLRFRFDYIKDKEYLTLKIPKNNTSKRYFFPTLPRFSGDTGPCYLTNLNQVMATDGDTCKVVCKGEMRPGSYIIHGDDVHPTLTQLSQQTPDNSVTFPIKLKMSSNGMFDTGELTMLATQVHSGTEVETLMCQLAKEDETNASTKTNTRSILKSQDSGGQTKPRVPSRGEEVRDISAMMQHIVPEKYDDFSEDELSKLDKLTMSDSFLQDAAFKRSGLFPAHAEEEEDAEEEPDFGNATSDEIKELRDIFKTHAGVWARHKYDVGEFKGFSVNLKTRPGEVIKQKEREHNIEQTEAAREVIEALLQAGILEKVDPKDYDKTWASNYLCQEKSDKKQTSKADKIQKKRAGKAPAQGPNKAPRPAMPMEDRDSTKEHERGDCSSAPQAKTSKAKKTKTSGKLPRAPAHPTTTPPDLPDSQETPTERRRWRLLMDNRQLNDISVKTPPPSYPPLDLINLKTRGDYVFSFDVSNSFHSISLNPSCAYKTGFWYNGEIIIWKRLVQGFVCSSFYQQLMFNAVFSLKNLNEFKSQNPDFSPADFQKALIQYSDDFLLFGRNTEREKFLLNVRCVFFCLDKEGLKLQRRKAHFFATCYDFLGTEVNLDEKSCRIQSWKSQAVQEWERPATKLELLSRLACLQYYSQHLPNWKLIGLPLFRLAQDQTPFCWTITEEKAWHNLKMLVKLHISLTIPSTEDDLLLSSDSSLCGASAVMMTFRNKILTPVAFLSRLYSKGIIRRSILAKECTAGGFALEKFRRLIENSKKVVNFLIDSHALLFCRNYSKSNQAIWNFSLLLQSFDNIQLLALPGEMNLIADQLCRWVTNAIPRKYDVLEDKTELEHISKEVMEHKSPVLYTKSDLLEMLNAPPLDAMEDINPSGNYQRPLPDKSGLQTLEELLSLAGDPPELAFLRLGADKVSEQVRRHQLWAKVKKLKSQKPLTDLDIINLKKKYRLENFDLSLFNYNTEVEECDQTPVLGIEIPHHQPHQDENVDVTEDCALLPQPVLPATQGELSEVPGPLSGVNIHQASRPHLHDFHLCEKSFCDTSNKNKEFIQNIEKHFSEYEKLDRESIRSSPEEPCDKKLNFTEIATLVNPVNPVMTGQAETSRRSSEVSPDQPEDEVFHFRPTHASNFVKKTKTILKVTGDNPELLKSLKNYQISKRREKVNLYKKCLEYAERITNTTDAEFAALVPCCAMEGSDIIIRPGVNCLELTLAKPLTIGKHELKILNLFTFFHIGDHGRNLYLEADKDILKTSILHCPDHVEVASRYNFFHKCYICPQQKVTLPAGTRLYQVKGFLARFSTMHIEKPDCYKMMEIDGKTHEVGINCNHKVVSEKQGVSYACYPALINNATIQPLFKYLQQYWDRETISQFFAEWTHFNVTDLGTPASAKSEGGEPQITPPAPPAQNSAPPEKNSKKGSKSSKKSEISGTPPHPPRTAKNDPKIPENLVTLTPSDNNPARLNNLLYLAHTLHSNKIFTKDTLSYFLSYSDYRAAYESGKYEKIDGLLYKQNKSGSNIEKKLLLLPEQISRMVLEKIHEQYSAHITANQMKLQFDRRYASLASTLHTATQVVQSCSICTFNRVNYNARNKGNERTFKPKRAFECLYIDYAHQLPVTKRGMNAALVICDGLTNFSFLVPVPQMSQRESMAAIGSIFAIFGPPDVLLSDSSNAFGGEFTEFLSSWGVYHHRMTPARSQSVGSAETSLKNIRHQLSKIVSSNPENRENWDILCAQAMRSYNLQTIYNLREHRAALFFGGSNNLYSNDTTFYNFDENHLAQSRKKLSEIRESKAKRGFKAIFSPGQCVTRHLETKSIPIKQDSRYLLDTEQSIYKILDCCEYSALVKNMSNGALSVVTPSTLRKIDLNTDKPITWPRDQRTIDSFKASRFRPGNQMTFAVNPKELGDLPQYMPMPLDQGDPAANLVSPEDTNTNRHSKRVKIRESLNRIHDIR